MKKEYVIPEITMIEFTAKDMVTASLMDSSFGDTKTDPSLTESEEHDFSDIFG